MGTLQVSFAGAGRVAGALSREMYHAGIKINRVVSPSEHPGKEVAINCNASWSPVLSFDPSDDIIIVAVPDHKLGEVLAGLECGEKTIVVHTAGSYGLEVFPPGIIRSGVFYPLQTFSKERRISFAGLPFLLEGSSMKITDVLGNLAEAIGGKTFLMDAEQRRMIHLSAVFVCNFTNYMLTAGSEITSKAGISFEILVPLIRETINKALEDGPEKSQTGPAVRNDINTIEKHIELLSFSPELQKIYREITGSIMRFYK
jgi:predicted short-subunit dehydrogenase-like oxidoreductase (DUF2520 family)